MDTEQAAKVAKGLRQVSRALDRAVEAMQGIDKASRNALMDPLATACVIVSGKLRYIYDRYPEFEPPPKPPLLYSELTWSEVTLPSPVTADQLDEIILSILKPRLRKVLAVVLDAEERFNKVGWAISREVTAARLQELSDVGRIESDGDLRYWGASEVRLKD